MLRQFMIDAGIAPVYLNGTPYLSEAVALLNELVVMDDAARRCADPSDRARFEQAFLDKALDVFYSAQDAELEFGVYAGVEAGRLHRAADFDSLSRAIDSAYSIWPPRVPELAHRWMQVRLMWEDPLYLVNYVLADLIGLKLFALYQQDPGAFATRYQAFLRAGYSGAPDAMLKQYFGFDLAPSALLDDATTMIADRLKAYAAPATSRLELMQFQSDSVNFGTSTAIVGPTEAVVVDAQYYRSDAEREVDSLAKLGKQVTAIIITHPHEDHYFGAAAFAKRFPGIKVYMTDSARAVFRRTSPRFYQSLRDKAPDELPDSFVTPTLLAETTLGLDGERLVIIPERRSTPPWSSPDTRIAT